MKLSNVYVVLSTAEQVISRWWQEERDCEIYNWKWNRLGNRELKQTRRRRKRGRHLKMWLRVSAIIFQLFILIILEKYVVTILGLNWNQRLGHKKTKLNICHHILTSSTQLQNRSFYVIERTRTSSKCQKMKYARAKRAKNTVFYRQICKFAGVMLPSSSWLLKLPINNVKNQCPN